MKWSVITILSLVTILVLFGVWFMSLLPEPKISKEVIQNSTPAQLAYLAENVVESKGKILAVVTSTDTMGISGKPTGYELTELSRAYYVFQANGFEVDIASPLGGEPPVVLDKGDMKEYDYAFLNDPIAQTKVKNSMPIASVDPALYQAIYFVGGIGAMFDFPDNEAIQSIVSNYYEQGKVIAAVCHGPAALTNVTLSDGSPLIANKKLCSFTNEEELLLIPDAKDIFPFLLQEKLTERGARFNQGKLYERITVKRKTLTNQTINVRVNSFVFM